jgi:small subunit ribosomal protein S21
MTEIIIGENDRLDWALKKFRRTVQRSGVLKALGKKRFYVKPSLARRLKTAAARRRLRMKTKRR